MGVKARIMKADWEPYLEGLRALPFVRHVKAGDGVVLLATADGLERLSVTTMRGALGYARVNSLIAQQRGDARWILFAPYVSPGVAERIAHHGGNFIDEAGNCYVAIGDRYLAHLTGKRPEPQRTGHEPLRGPGLHVLLALLAEPALAAQPVRALAERAAASKSTAASVLNRLRADGSVFATKGATHVDGKLWDTFATGYAASLRPVWMRGAFRAQERDLAELEQRIAAGLGNRVTWAWGGGAAADRLIHYYHGPTTVVHLAELPGELPHELRLLRAQDGPLILIRTPCPAAFTSKVEHVVAPPLVYAELIYAGDDRALETAAMIRDEYLKQAQ